MNINDSYKEHQAIKDDVRTKLNKMVHDSRIKRKDVAKRMNVTHPYVTKVLNGQDSVTLNNMCKFATALGYKLNITFQKL